MAKLVPIRAHSRKHLSAFSECALKVAFVLKTQCEILLAVVSVEPVIRQYKRHMIIVLSMVRAKAK